jgi:hypothetical protein
MEEASETGMKKGERLTNPCLKDCSNLKGIGTTS